MSDTIKIKYVLGFLFDTEGTKLALILKNKPEFQRGLYNGIGGKVEESDGDVLNAMVREFREEAYVGVPATAWNHFATMSVPEHNGNVTCFCAFSDLVSRVKSMTKEKIKVFNLEDVPVNTLPNIPWLISMALCTRLPNSKFYSLIEL